MRLAKVIFALWVLVSPAYGQDTNPPSNPPGDYKLFAWEQIEDEAFKDPEFLALYEARGTSVHVEEKKQQYLQLPLIPAEESAP